MQVVGVLSGLIPPVHSPGLSGVPHPHGPLLAAAGGHEVWHGAVVCRGDAPGMAWTGWKVWTRVK